MAILWIDKMAVDARGEGEAVVFVHGLGGSLNAWTPLLPALGRYRCIRVELPGAGRSRQAYALAESGPARGRLSIDVLSDSVIRVCQALGLQSAHLVGHSLGTIVCQHVAAKLPKLVRSLSLFGAMAEPAQAMRDNMIQRAAVARDQGLFEIAEIISEFALSPSTREKQPVTVAYVRESIAAQDPEGFARNCIALAEAQAARTELIRCPVLVVNGDEDMVTPLSGARALASRLSDARVEVLGRCGHWPTLERPLESQRLLRDFLDRVR
jgi:pimeloyl-ACP methyl ester carboxylesterase